MNNNKKNTFRTTCITPGCGMQSAKSGLRFFKVPEDERKANIWFRALKLSPSDIINKHNFICEQHFDPVFKGQNRLTKNAVPNYRVTACNSNTNTFASQSSPEPADINLKSSDSILYKLQDAITEEMTEVQTKDIIVPIITLSMGNNNSTSKVIEISDSDNDDESPSPSKEKTVEMIVENLPSENELNNNSPIEDNIIIDSDDDEVDTPPKESDKLVENQETSKTYYPPEFINIELLNKIKPSTPELKTDVDKNDKAISENIIEKINTKIIELFDDAMEIEDDIKTDEKEEETLQVATTMVPMVEEQKEESEIIDLDQNDAIECVEESKEKDTVSDLKCDEIKDIENTMSLDKNDVEELIKDDKNDKENEEIFDLDKIITVNDQVPAAPKVEDDDLQTMTSEALTTLVNEIIPKSAAPDDLMNFKNSAVKKLVEEEIIDLDDSGDSDTLPDETLQELAKVLSIQDSKRTNIESSCASQSTNEINVKAAITSDPIHETDNIEANETITEELNINSDDISAPEAAPIDQNSNTASIEISINTENVEGGNICAVENDVIDLDANDNDPIEIPIPNDSENLNQCNENIKKNENNLTEKIIETELSGQHAPQQDEEEIICLDDADDNKEAEDLPDSNISPTQAIESDKSDNKDKNITSGEVNIEPVNQEYESTDVEMEAAAPTADTNVIDLDLDNNEGRSNGEINTATHIDMQNNDKSSDVEMEVDVPTTETDVIDLNLDNNENTDTPDTANIESNLKNMTIDNQSTNMEKEHRLEEQLETNDESITLSKNDLNVETSSKIEMKTDDETVVVNKSDTKNEVADVAVNPLQECVNYHCSRTTNITSPAPIFVLSFYRINKKSNKRQFVCENCYDNCVEQYEQMTGDIIAHNPIVFKPKSQPDLIELSDSDEDDANSDTLKRKNPGSNKALNLIENNESNKNALGNLEDIIEKAFSQINIDLQLKKRTDIINRTIETNEAMSTALFNDIRELQKSADKMHFTLYQKYPNRIIKELPPIDLNIEDKLNLPPLGDINYPPIEIGKKYLAPRHAISGAWVECDTLEILTGHPSDGRKHGTHWKVMFCRRATKLVLSIKHIAYSVSPDVRLNVGTRVVAIFQQVPVPKQSFFPGTVGETLKDSNKYRYLIFFDDGYCQYVKHEHVRLICEVSTNVWEDIDGNPGTSRFIQEFLTQFHNRISRPMLLAKRGQKIVTEFNGIWKLSKVVDVDCNLIKMYMEKNQTFEWIYRGSSRFAPIFKHRHIGSGLQLIAMNYHLKKRNEPYIEMTLDEVTDPDYQPADSNRTAELQADPKGLEHPTATRAVARKSTNQGSKNNGAVNNAPVSLNNSVIVVDDDKMPKGKVTYYETTKRYSTTTYTVHKCTPACLVRVEDNLEPFNPIARPLLSGWERQICKYKSRKIAIYRAPCGRRLRTMLEVHRYLRLTDSPLNVECFDYDTTMHCLAEYTDLPQFIRNTDLSDGTEKMPISCCNYFDKTTPPTCTYSTNRIPTEGVNLNLDPDFLCACDCEDDCIDKSKCQCWQLTIKGACSINSALTVDDVGYCFKRLLNPVSTGIYECNSRCKCKQNCLNRVVQHPLSVKLQVFKTTNRGWGLRTLHDIPKGSFICIYAGDLLTEQSSNELGAKEGDEYFAELDYIEAVEGLKEGYESDIPREEGDEEPELDKDDDFDNSADADSDDDDFTSKCKIDKKITTRSSTRSSKNQYSKKLNVSYRPPSTPIIVPPTVAPSAEDDDCITISDDEEVRAPVNFIPNTSYDDDTEVDSKYKSVRKLFGKDELGYVMDAKRNGNIGRYFNHSCNPNLFVQNVFVDTHDLRFPWVTFFSNTSIQAGTELTWNYNYDVGCVPGKVLYCQCDSSNCRGRLL